MAATGTGAAQPATAPPRAAGPALRLAWRHAAVDLTAAPRSVPVARRLVRLVLASWELAGLAESAELIASELVTNAIAASATAGHHPVIRLRITSRVYAVVVAVWDGSDQWPVPRRDGAADALGGRGLMLVGALADRWGAERAEEGGKTVFAVISRAAGPSL
jgi:anti-sigma regulatory factor (Ser/Thr protein kinase)